MEVKGAAFSEVADGGGNEGDDEGPADGEEGRAVRALPAEVCESRQELEDGVLVDP